jgi:pimeloyl-ACP methyl ester carboxylesterase
MLARREVVNDLRHGPCRFAVLLAGPPHEQRAPGVERFSQRLVDAGAAVFNGARHVDDFVVLASRARAAHPGLPHVALGWGLGAPAALCYAQQHGEDIEALVICDDGCPATVRPGRMIGLQPTLFVQMTGGAATSLRVAVERLRSDAFEAQAVYPCLGEDEYEVAMIVTAFLRRSLRHPA